MSNIYVETKNNVEVKEKVRTNRITINNPHLGKKTINFRNEKLTLVDDVETGKEKFPNTNRDFDAVITELITVTDPVTQQEVTVSIAGIATIVEAAFIKWWNEDNPED